MWAEATIQLPECKESQSDQLPWWYVHLKPANVSVGVEEKKRILSASRKSKCMSWKTWSENWIELKPLDHDENTDLAFPLIQVYKFKIKQTLRQLVTNICTCGCNSRFSYYICMYCTDVGDSITFWSSYYVYTSTHFYSKALPHEREAVLQNWVGLVSDLPSLLQDPWYIIIEGHWGLPIR